MGVVDEPVDEGTAARSHRMSCSRSTGDEPQGVFVGLWVLARAAIIQAATPTDSPQLPCLQHMTKVRPMVAVRGREPPSR